MAEELKGLIEKIQEEGVRSAEERGRGIESEARRKADEILKKARGQADDMVSRAKDEIARMEASGEASIRQAGRDMLLALREEIMALLNKIILAESRKALTPEELGAVITALVKQQGQRGDIIVSLNKADAEKLEKALMASLKEEMKKGITLRPSEEIRAGFIISFDGGKSHFDFTDKGLVEYLSLYLRPRLAELLKDAAGGKTV